MKKKLKQRLLDGMRRRALALLPLALAPLAFANETAAVPQTTTIQGDANLRSSAIEDAYQQTRVMGLGLNASLQHRFAEDWTTSLSAAAILETGSAESFFTDEYRPVHTLLLQEAAVEWAPARNTTVRLGALNQNFHESPLLIQGATFPGAFQKWRSPSLPLYIELSAEQAVPTSSTTSVLPTQKNGSSFYDLERVAAGYESPSGTARLHLSHFAFQNLSGSIANESRFRGNSVAGIGDAGAQFFYAYEGIESALAADLRLSSELRAQIGANFLHNFRAPSDRNQAALLYLGTRIPTGRGSSLSPRVSYFRTEADASPGYYNSGALAHNNRQGLMLGARAELPANRVEMELQLIRANVIEMTPFQADFTGFFFNLRKSYDLL